MDERTVGCKNLLEFKNAQRVLVEGNHFENCWPNAQSGFALLIKPRNQNNTAPWSVTQDITIRFNTFDNVAQGIKMSGYDSPNISQRTSRILIQNNVLNVTNLGSGGDEKMFQILNGPTRCQYLTTTRGSARMRLWFLMEVLKPIYLFFKIIWYHMQRMALSAVAQELQIVLLLCISIQTGRLQKMQSLAVLRPDIQ